mgnify:CR=1 FL=1
MHNPHILIHSRGPQFKSKGGVLFVFLLLASLLFAIAVLFLGDYIIPIPFIIISIILFSYVLDIHGCEIDINEFKIREYKLFLWRRIGNWDSIKNYKYVYLTKGSLRLATSDYPEYSDHPFDTYNYFFVKLIDEFHNKEIVIAEFREFSKAQKLMQKIAYSLRIEPKVFVN